jgi:hypothetical protein
MGKGNNAGSVVNAGLSDEASGVSDDGRSRRTTGTGNK